MVKVPHQCAVGSLAYTIVLAVVDDGGTDC